MSAYNRSKIGKSGDFKRESSGSDRPRFRDSGSSDRPRFRDSASSDRPRFRDSGDRPRFRDSGDRPRSREGGDRPRFRSSGDRPRFRRDSGDFRGGRKELQMTRVICDKCGKSCEVPFKPTEGKPIYCSECFKTEKGESNAQSSRELDKINDKLDKILDLLKAK